MFHPKSNSLFAELLLIYGAVSSNIKKLMRIYFILFFNLLFFSTFSQVDNEHIIYERYADFEKTIDSLKVDNRKSYVKFINLRLENNEEFFIQEICSLIKKDSLFECIPHLKNYITSCKRNSFYHSEDAIYTLNYFKQDNSNFIIEDFKKHLKVESCKHSCNPKSWLSAYIYYLRERNIEISELVDNAFFDWHGINTDFAKFPKLFDIKKELEKEYFRSFSGKLTTQGFKLMKVIAYIDNTKEVIKGSKPAVRYIIQVSFPNNDSFSMDNKFQDLKEKSILAIKEINLPEENIFFIFGNQNMTFEKSEDRFSKFTLVESTLNYLKKNPKSNLESLIKILYEKKYFD